MKLYLNDFRNLGMIAEYDRKKNAVTVIFDPDCDVNNAYSAAMITLADAGGYKDEERQLFFEGVDDVSLRLKLLAHLREGHLK